jgi:hypothetical protein
MRKIIALASVAAAGACLLPSSAPAAVQSCGARATWSLYMTADGPFADVAIDRSTASGPACAALLPAADPTYELEGVFTVGLPDAGAGQAFTQDGSESGTFAFGHESLQATLTGTTAGGTPFVAVHMPDGGCGPACYRTRVSWMTN